VQSLKRYEVMMMMMLKRNFVSVAVSASLLWGCQSVDTTQPGTVGVDRDQRMMVSAQEVEKAEAQKKGALDRDAAQVQRVKAIVSRLVPQTGVFRPDALKWAWEAHVISIDEANAWCMPGGKMAVYTGLIQKLQLTDDELAAVMGHEIAHALREHSREQMSRQMATQMGIGIAGALFGVGELGQGLGNMVADVTLNLPKSRLHETEADRIGVELAARAGYDPHAALRLWEKMAKSAGGGQPPKWLSTHPSHEDRLKDLQVYAEKVKPLYAAAKGSPSAGR
jgi:predicted Zn-dependent protease